MLGPHRRAIIEEGLHATWSPDLRAALDGRYGAFRWGVDGSDKEPSAEFRDFVEEHARDWLAMRNRAEGRAQSAGTTARSQYAT